MNIYQENYTAIDRTPYTYLITHKATGKKYYGCRYKKYCHPTDLWTTYFTSSNIISDLILKEGKDAFDYKVDKIFDNIKDCRNYEKKILIKNDASHNSIWFNLTNGAIFLEETKKKKLLRQKSKLGERNPCAILTDEKIKEIRFRYKTTDVTYQELADEFGIFNTTLEDILMYRTWKHVEDIYTNRNY